MVKMNKTTRTLLFLFGCIPLRFLISVLVKHRTVSCNVMGWILSLIGFTFMYLFLTKSRMSAIEGGGVTYWANFRPIHGLLYMSAGYLLLSRCDTDTTYKLLLCDTLIGLAVFISNQK